MKTGKGMKLLNQIAAAANTVLMVFAALAAAVMLASGLYVLNDIYYTNRTAFVSYDLLQYRPKLGEDPQTEEYTYSELRQINPDTVGWIEMFGTNINYPVVQGRDNLEYLNKDIFGYSTLTGSIYLAAENDADLSDWYNMIYGHHMESGAMFGDIEKYLDPEYFAAHSDGILQTEHGDYRIRVFACVRTNAYEDTVYQLDEDAESRYPVLKEYIAEHAVNGKTLPEDMPEDGILGLSTCSDAVTDGRIVLFAGVEPWNDSGIPAQVLTQAEEQPEKHLAVGHKLQKGRWSFLNLLCVVCTFLTFLPVWAMRRKFGQLTYSKKAVNRLEKQADDAKQKQDAPANQPEETEKLLHDLKHFLKKSKTGILLEAVIFGVSAAVFLLTEDLTGRMGIRDRWTRLMILIAAAALLADIICLRYRGRRPDETAQPKEQ